MKREKLLSRMQGKKKRTAIVIALMALALLLASVAAPPRRAASGFAASGRCDDLSGKWRITTSEGDSTWELRKNGPMYEARESGTGDARGLAALMQGNVLRLEFDVRTETGERYAGIYRCKLDDNCQASLSPCKLVLGLGRTGTYEATIKRQ